MVYGVNLGSGGQQGPRKRPVASAAEKDTAPTSYRTTEGKIARKLGEMLNVFAFDATTFAYMLKVEAGPALKRRVMDIVIALIKDYADDYDRGIANDQASIDAKRLKDTLDQFKM